MPNVIEVNGISKRYYLGGRQSHSTLRDLIVDTATSPLRKNARDEFWALKDINFSLKEGDTLGIIGRNGAGKSTLLKILSRITKPTSGEARIHGRVASLLEVGTGFHSELSGKENIFLNGAILGMRRREILRKFDEIVAFAEIDKFLDTPVKHYSSGMYMRLAFAVAAHLEPEILIVDEVLAVGDAEFQKKCLGKMNEVSQTGRTVIFVSHQLGSVAQLCKSAILLDKGEVVTAGDTTGVIEHYINKGKSNLALYTADKTAEMQEIYVRTASILNDEAAAQSSFRHDEAITVGVTCAVNKMVRAAELRMVLRNGKGTTIFTTDAELGTLDDETRAFNAEFTIPRETLRPDNYSVELSIFVPHQTVIESMQDVLFFSVFDSGTKYAQSEGVDYGVIFSPCSWTVKPDAS